MTLHDPGLAENSDQEAAFGRAAGEMLRRGADEIDAATASRLNRARQAALAELPGRRRRSWFLPALSTAGVAALALGLWFGRGAEPVGPVAPAAVEAAGDLDLLLAADSLEMYEDLEFYAWLDVGLSDAEFRDLLDSTG
jgi:hypothetical protein